MNLNVCSTREKNSPLKHNPAHDQLQKRSGLSVYEADRFSSFTGVEDRKISASDWEKAPQLAKRVPLHQFAKCPQLRDCAPSRSVTERQTRRLGALAAQNSWTSSISGLKLNHPHRRPEASARGPRMTTTLRSW